MKKLDKKKKNGRISVYEYAWEGGNVLGFVVEGLFAGFEVQEYKNDDGSIDIRKTINVATGRNAYPVYMKDDFDVERAQLLDLGMVIRVACRVYASKAGRITCVDGELL